MWTVNQLSKLNCPFDALYVGRNPVVKMSTLESRRSWVMSPVGDACGFVSTDVQKHRVYSVEPCQYKRAKFKSYLE